MKTRTAKILTLEFTLPIVLFVSWWIVSARSTNIYIPPLKQILSSLRTEWFADKLTSDVLPSLARFVCGFAIALAIGMGGGLILGLLPKVRSAVYPETEFSRALPIAALVPAALILIGPGTHMEIILIAFAGTWPILINTIDGVRSVDPLVLSVGRVYGLSASQRLRRIVLPSAMPQIFAGIEVALPIGIATMVIANMVGSSNGIGYSVIDAEQSFDILGTWSGLILIGLIGCLINLVFVIVRRSALSWHRGWRALDHQ